MLLLAQNVNALLVLVGFIALESGIGSQWSWSAAAIVGGSLMMIAGSWPYVRKRKP